MKTPVGAHPVRDALVSGLGILESIAHRVRSHNDTTIPNQDNP